jgi:glycosyltransferase involved in cell wall biosynthesis
VKISIVIPAFNEEKLIGDTLRSVDAARQAFVSRGWASEVIVCDNNSTDHTGELARAAGAIVVHEPVNQIGRARNTGARAASGDWLLFIDADSRPSPELFADVAATIFHGDCLAGGSTVRLDSNSRAGAFGTGLWNVISRTAKYLAGSFIFCDAAVFRELGGFNERLYASEEIELSRRLKALARARGKRIVILRHHPLLTSARKLRLYSAGEHFRFLCRTLLHWNRTLEDRDACHTWYDGRR